MGALVQIRFRSRSALAAIILIVFSFATHPLGADQYCGVYALFGAAKVLGVDCNLEPIVNEKYVTSWKGSTVQNLIEAGEVLGVHVTPLHGLGRTTLESARDPLLLHVTSHGQIHSFNHWLLFIGIEKGKARIVDDTGQVVLIDLPFLMARWDGIALAVHKNLKPETKFAKAEISHIGFLLALFGLAALLIRYLSKTFRKSGLTISTVVLAGCLIILTFMPMYDFFSSSSLAAINYQASAHGARSFPSISRTELLQLIQSDQPSATRIPNLIVDSRFPDDVEYLGTIPGAINLPVNISDKKLQEMIEATSLDAKVVVFCLSRNCRYDQLIAIRLTGLGFKNIRLYEPGWYGWIEGEEN